MSSVRMCDKCGKVFSELEDGWATMSGSQSVINPITGKRETREAMQDTCGECNAVGLNGPRMIAQVPIPEK